MKNQNTAILRAIKLYFRARMLRDPQTLIMPERNLKRFGKVYEQFVASLFDIDSISTRRALFDLWACAFMPEEEEAYKNPFNKNS